MLVLHDKEQYQQYCTLDSLLFSQDVVKVADVISILSKFNIPISTVSYTPTHIRKQKELDNGRLYKTSKFFPNVHYPDLLQRIRYYVAVDRTVYVGELLSGLVLREQLESREMSPD